MMKSLETTEISEIGKNSLVITKVRRSASIEDCGTSGNLKEHSIHVDVSRSFMKMF